MKRSWGHRFGLHGRCHPSGCKKSADWCNRILSEQRTQDVINQRKVQS